MFPVRNVPFRSVPFREIRRASKGGHWEFNAPSPPLAAHALLVLPTTATIIQVVYVNKGQKGGSLAPLDPPLYLFTLVVYNVVIIFSVHAVICCVGAWKALMHALLGCGDGSWSSRINVSSSGRKLVCRKG